VKYFFTIPTALPDTESRALYAKLKPFGTNLTILESKSYIYGHVDMKADVDEIERIISEAGYSVERG
jgi:hypothetical protein